jgi:lambda repressor-like predicted transcriptional regulator
MARKSNAGTRLSVAPLLGALAANNIELEYLDARLNNNVRQAKFRGYFTLATADEIACDILKMHPIEIWGDEYAEAAWFDGNEDIDTSANGDRAKDVRPELREAVA